MTVLKIETCGPGTSLQDTGRFGWQRYGVGPAGAMDRNGLAVANLLVGNGPGAAAIECALAGLRFTIDGGSARIALAGAGADLKIDGVTTPAVTSITVHAGQRVDVTLSPRRRLHVSRCRWRLRGRSPFSARSPCTSAPASVALAAARSEAAISSRSLCPRHRAATSHRRCRCPAPRGRSASCSGRRMITSRPRGSRRFLGSGYTITAQADRMGIRLAGPKIAHDAKGYNIVSDGIATGSIQVPGMGEPLILLADRQTTGGYPKIATVISADLGRLAQMRPGDTIRFIAISRTDARAALEADARALAAFRAGLKPAGALDLDSSRLLALNLVDGWVDAYQ